MDNGLFYLSVDRLVAFEHSFGHKNLKAIAQFVGTRTSTQVRTHAQKHAMKLVIMPHAFIDYLRCAARAQS